MEICSLSFLHDGQFNSFKCDTCGGSLKLSLDGLFMLILFDTARTAERGWQSIRECEQCTRKIQRRSGFTPVFCRRNQGNMNSIRCWVTKSIAWQEPSLQKVQSILLELLEDGKPVSKFASTLMEFAACLLQHQKFADFKDPDRCNSFLLDAFYTVLSWVSFTVSQISEMSHQDKVWVERSGVIEIQNKW